MSIVHGRLLRVAVVLFSAVVLSIWSPVMPAHAATVTVTTVDITVDAAGSCGSVTIGSLPGPDTVVSLPEAICATNNTPGADTIAFNIPGSGVKTIAYGAVLGSTLPPITESVTIDGYTQPGASANTQAAGSDAVLLIEIAMPVLAVGGISVEANDVTIRGLSVASNTSGLPVGISVSGTNARLVGNYIGVHADGVTRIGSFVNAVHVRSSGNATIGGPAPADRNVISAGGWSGIRIAADASSGTTILNNYIGSDASGTGVVSNGYGVEALGPAVQIGSPGAGNVISGNGIAGILIIGEATVQSNRIGTNAVGTAAIPNPLGIELRGGTGALIGTNADGTNDAAEGNLISGNSINGIVVNPYDLPGSDTHTFTIAGNLIGTNASGTAAIPNRVGIEQWSTTDLGAFTIGGTVPAARNVISGNTEAGLRWQTFSGTAALADSLLIGNYIGLNAAGTGPLPNGGPGILHASSQSRLVVGGTGAGQGNIIRYNAGDGITHTGTAPLPIRGNSIDQNGGLGIDLANDEVNVNDPGDGDSGPNGHQNSPVLTSAFVIGTTTRIAGTLNSAANTSFALDFFSSPSCDASGSGEGATFLGTTTASTDGSGNLSFSVDLAAASAVGHAITATATNPNRNTSEFAACRTAAAPGVIVSKSSVTVTEGGSDDTFTVALTSVPSSEVRIVRHINPGRFSVSPIGLVFQPDATALIPQTFTVSAVNNTEVDGTHSEDIPLSASSSDPSYHNFDVQHVIVTVLDDDTAGAISFTAATASVNENGGSVTLTVQRTGGAASGVTVQYGTGDQTARAGVDFTTTTGTLSFALGETTKTITVPIKDAPTDGDDDTFTVTLANPQGGATLGSPNVATVTIVDTTTGSAGVQGQDDTDPSRKNTREDKDIKETQEQQQQRERTNRGNRDDIATEGNVTEVHLDAAPPYVVMGNRDGAVVVRLLCGDQCPTIRVGDYIEVDGEKQHEQLFDAEQVTVRK